MRLGKTIKLGLVVAGSAAAIAAGVIYIQASRIPRGYRPAQLSAEQKQQAAKEFLNRKILHEFGNAAQRNEPFDWVITQDQLNRYLSAMDEIAASAPSAEPGMVYRGMEEAGLAAPAVLLQDGKVTLMVRSSRHQKILSADVSFAFTRDRKLRVRLLAARVGLLTLPDSWVRQRIEELRSAALAGLGDSEQSGRSGGGLAGFSSRDVGDVLAAVLAGIDREPISTELTWRVNKKHVRIEGIDIADGTLRLRVVPAGRKGSRPASRR